MEHRLSPYQRIPDARVYAYAEDQAAESEVRKHALSCHSERRLEARAVFGLQFAEDLAFIAGAHDLEDVATVDQAFLAGRSTVEDGRKN